MPPTGSEAAASTSPDITKDNFIPLFNNKPSDYKEWRSRISLYGKKMTLQNKGKESIINLLTSLNGVAWRQVEHIADNLAEASDGFEKTLKVLDAAFKYDSRVEAPKAMELYFYSLGRRPDQTLLTYCSEHRERKREVEKHGITVSDSIDGWLLLRRAGLTAEQRQLVLAQCGSELKTIKVEEVMFFLFGQDYKTQKSWTKPQSNWRYNKHQRYQRAYAMDESDLVEDEEVYVGDDTNEYDMASAYDSAPWIDETVYYEDMPEPEDTYEEAYDQWEQDDEDAEVEEAYSNYLDARRRFAEIKSARGYWPVVAVPPDGSGSAPSTSPPPQKGNNKGKGKNRGKGRGGGGSQRPMPPRGGKLASRASGAGYNVNCLKCGQPGHWAAQCPMNSSPNSRSTTSSPMKKPRTDGPRTSDPP